MSSKTASLALVVGYLAAFSKVKILLASKQECCNESYGGLSAGCPGRLAGRAESGAVLRSGRV